jgi:hypothetical protein
MARVIRTPPPPDPVQIEAQDWERIRTSNNVGDFDDFLRRHATGAHAPDARNRADQLRQQALANAARQADQAAWDATDQTRKASLQDYLRRFATGAHAQEAQGLISGIDNKQAATDRLAAQQAKEQQAKDQQAKEQLAKEQEAKNRAAAEVQAINRTISDYEAAYNNMRITDLERIWTGMPKPTRDNISAQFRDARSVTFKLTPVGQPVITGNSAVVDCARTSGMTPKSGPTPAPVSVRVTVTLERSGPGWVIRSMN